MSRLLIIIGLAVLITPAFLPEWLAVTGGVAFGGAVAYKVHRRFAKSVPSDSRGFFRGRYRT
jgi:hypothetical protein